MLAIEIDDKDLRRGVEALSKELPAEMVDTLDHAKRKFLKEWRVKRLSGPGENSIKGRPGGIFPQFQTTKMRSGTSDKRVVGIRIGTRSKVALLQEKGGTVNAGGNSSLAVPLFARTKMFRAPITGALRKRYKEPENLNNVVPMKFKGKSGEQVFLARKFKSKNRSPEPLFVLKKTVKIKPKLGYEKTFENMRPVLYNILASRILKATKMAWEG